MVFSIGLTLSVIGEILLAISLIAVHNKVMKERKIDRKVVTEFKMERHLAVLAMLFIVAGYLQTTIFG